MRPLQALFYGLARYWDVEIREPADVAEFELPELKMYVIVLDEPDARNRSADEDDLRSSGEMVVLLDREKCETLRRLDCRETFLHRLFGWQRQQASASFDRRYRQSSGPPGGKRPA